MDQAEAIANICSVMVDSIDMGFIAVGGSAIEEIFFACERQ